jgi:Lrp/AsnC family leucine-responsive transcriptional regulator
MSKSTRPAKHLDRLDRKILNVLQQDGRISYTDLGNRVGLSTSPCLERVRRLERDGYIRGYRAILDPQRLGAELLIYVELSLDYTSPDIFEQFKRAVVALPQVQECHLVSGDFDYLVKIRIADMAAYRELLGEILHGLPGVRDTKSYVVMEEVKETLALDID